MCIRDRRIIDHHVPHIDNIHIRRAGFTANPGTNAPQNPFYTLAMHKQFLDVYKRQDFHRGTFRVRGDVVEIFPAYSGSEAYRVEFFGDEVDRITRCV